MSSFVFYLYSVLRRSFVGSGQRAGGYGLAKRQLTPTTVLALTTLREQATRELGGVHTAAAIRVGTTAATEATVVTW